MNACIFTGRLVRDPEVNTTQSGKKVAKFTIAVDRNFKKGTGDEPTADFPQLVAWEKQADLVEQYCTKGKEVRVLARYETSSYTDKNGQKVYKHEFVTEKIELGASPNANTSAASSQSKTPTQAPAPARKTRTPEPEDDEVPF